MDKKKIILIITIVLIIVGVTLIIIGINQNENVIIDDPISKGDQTQNEDENKQTETNEYNAGTSEYLVEDYGDPIQIEGEQTYKGLLISNIEAQMISQRECEIRAIVENKTSETIEMQDIKITIYDAENNVQDTLGAQIDSIKPGEQKQLNALVRRRDVSDIARIEIEEN